MSVNLETGLWRCFKTGHTGNFIKLYANLERISYAQAYEKFAFDSLLYEPVEKEEKPVEIPENLGLEDIEELDPYTLQDRHIFATASEFVHSRGMADEKFYVSKSGQTENRLIIPFFNSKGKMYFYQARALVEGARPKYLNAKFFKSSHVLYQYDYNSYDPLFITEGVFDCLSLKKAGYNATTTLSCMVSNEQMNQLKHYQGPLVVAYDSDSAGIEGVHKFLKLARKHKIRDLYYSVPDGAKDWNELYLAGKLNPSIKPLDELELVIRTL